MGGWDRGRQALNAGNTWHAGSADQVGHASPELVYTTNHIRCYRTPLMGSLSYSTLKGYFIRNMLEEVSSFLTWWQSPSRKWNIGP